MHAVCGIDQLPDYQAQQVTHVLSLLDPNWPTIEAFAAFGHHERTIISFHDIITASLGKALPQRQQVHEILRLGDHLSSLAADAQPVHLLVHCHMGVSRSTAAMLIILAQAHPDQPEDRLFAHLREIRPQAWPNSVMIGLADDMLGRNGRLVAALRTHYAHQLVALQHYRDWMTSLGREQEVRMGESERERAAHPCGRSIAVC